MRLVSLVPSLSETLCDMGLEEALVGCTSFCTHPPRLRHTSQSLKGTKDFDREALLALKPTHVFVNTEENTSSGIAYLREKSKEHGFCLFESHPIEVKDVPHLVEDLGALLGKSLWAQNWSSRVRHKIEALSQRKKPLEGCTYAYFIWKEPWMVAGQNTFIAHLLRLLGLENAIVTGTELAYRYPSVSPQDPRLRQASFWLFASEPWNFLERHRAQFRIEALAPPEQPPDFKVDGRLLSWHGTSLDKALDHLVELESQLLAKSLPHQPLGKT